MSLMLTAVPEEYRWNCTANKMMRTSVQNNNSANEKKQLFCQGTGELLFSLLKLYWCNLSLLMPA